jgi:hypothetical protein
VFKAQTLQNAAVAENGKGADERRHQQEANHLP